MCRFNENNMGHLKFTVNCPSVNLPKWIRTSSQGTQLYGFVNSASVFSFSLAESEGTLILPQVENFHRLRDDDATTISSDDSFFSAAEVGSFFSSYKYWRFIKHWFSFPWYGHFLLFVLSWCFFHLRSCSMPCLYKMSISHWREQLFTKMHWIWSGKTRCNIDPWGKCVGLNTDLNAKSD